VEIGSHQLAATRILDPRSQEVGWMADYLEDVQFLRSGMGDYPEEKIAATSFRSAVSPRSSPTTAGSPRSTPCATTSSLLCDRYFNAIPSLLSLENLSFWEHSTTRAAGHKTHERGGFCAIPIMLVMERGDELWLAPDGDQASVQGRDEDLGLERADADSARSANTIRSGGCHGRIEAVIQPPKQAPPQRIVIRLRHPDGKPIRS